MNKSTADYIPDPTSGADFALDINNCDMAPSIPQGSTVLIERSAEATDGDLVLILHQGQMLCRRLIGDAFGNVYFVCDNTQCGKESIMVRRDQIKDTVCFGVVRKIIPPK